MNWKNLTSLEQFDDIDAQSQSSPVVLFKHSTRCSISATALSRLERKWNDDKHPGVDAYFIDLIAHRDISSAVAERYGVEHESPQVLIIDQGSCVYDNSHFGITYDEILERIAPASV